MRECCATCNRWKKSDVIPAEGEQAWGICPVGSGWKRMQLNFDGQLRTHKDHFCSEWEVKALEFDAEILPWVTQGANDMSYGLHTTGEDIPKGRYRVRLEKIEG